MDDKTPTGRPSGDPVDPADRPEPPPPSRRPRDMLISMLVLLVPVLVLFGGYQVVAGRTQPVVVDPAPVFAEARAAGFDFTEPAGLGEDWTSVSAVFRPTDAGATLRLGYVTPGGGSAQLVQSTIPAEMLLEEQLAEAGSPTGTLQVAGHSWQRYTTRPGEQALVLLAPERTTIVVGTAPESQLRDLATAAR